MKKRHINVVPLLFWAAVASIGGFLLAPLIVIIASSFTNTFYLAFPPQGLTLRWYGQLVGDREWVTAFGTSLTLAAGSTVIVGIVSLPAAITLVRRGFKAAQITTVFLMAPIMVPSLMYVLGSMLVYSEFQINPPLWGVALALSVLTAPYMLRTLMAGLEQLDGSIEDAALSLGARPARVWVEILIPNVLRSFGSGALVSFIMAFDELLVPLFLAGIDTPTLPVKIFESVSYDMDPSIAAVSTLLIFVSVVGVAVMIATSTTPIEEESG